MEPEFEHDEIDRLFARLAPLEPPDDFVARVLARAQHSEVARWPRWQGMLFGAVYVGALLVLALLAFMTGIELEHAHIRDLLDLAIQDVGLVLDSPGPYVAAIRDALPWTHLVALAADITLVIVATRLLLRVAKPRPAGAMAA